MQLLLHVLIFDVQLLAGPIVYMHSQLSGEVSFITQYFPKSTAADLPKANKLRAGCSVHTDLLARIIANTSENNKPIAQLEYAHRQPEGCRFQLTLPIKRQRQDAIL